LSARKKVLIIDDEESIVVYLTTVLEDHGYAPLSAMDAEEGARLARAEVPDFICMDIMMPKMSGISLYEEFKKDPKLTGIPMVFISAFTMVRDLRSSEAFRKIIPDESIPQPEMCLEKPIAVDEFISVISSRIGPGEEA
jgi:CheY-like chemotaxis protein